MHQYLKRRYIHIFGNNFQSKKKMRYEEEEEEEESLIFFNIFIQNIF